MLGSAVVVFRETLEAALIVAIVMGATRGVARRGRWIAGGVMLGILGALVVAAFVSTSTWRLTRFGGLKVRCPPATGCI